MERQVWFFPVANGETHFDDNGTSYFEEQAAEKAARGGYELVTTRNASVDGSCISGWVISGTVVLKRPPPAVQAAPALQVQTG
jgi:hypothetical protein